MIKLVFATSQRKIIKFEIEEKRVKYFDDNWTDGILIMPLEDPKVRLQVKKMVLSRRPNVSAMGVLITDANLGENKKEYDKCNTDEEIAEVIKKDCKLKGLLEV